MADKSENVTRLSKELLYHGTSESRLAPVFLQAGPLTLRFDPDTAFLRQIRLGDHEAVRAIYGAVRARDWTTICPQVSALEIDSRPDSFQISFRAEHREGDIHFVWNGRILGESDGTVIYSFDGEALSSFERMRIGLCVLHPLTECAGKPVAIEHTDGSVEEGQFPRFVSPVEPFKDIRAIRYEPAPMVQVEIRFEGEIFEMEDQRNWTDASFKTYGTPAELPRPVLIEKGTKVRQKATISLPGEPRKILPVVQGRDPQVSISTTPVLAKPPIGLQTATHGHPLSEKEIARLKALGLSHLRVDLNPAEPGFADRLRRAATEASQLGVRLHVALHLGEQPESELDRLAEAVQDVRPPVSLWMVFSRNEPCGSESLTRLAKSKLAGSGTNVLFATGALHHFHVLNNNLPADESGTLPCFSVTPQVHAFDETTMAENLAGQASIVESLNQCCSRSPVISPITFLPHGLPDVKKIEADSELPEDVDRRQMSLFCAVWTLGSLSRLATSGTVHSLTYYETTDGRGVMAAESGSPLPEHFPVIPGSVFPVYFIFAFMGGYTRMYPSHSSHPLQIEAMTLINDRKQRRILVANLWDQPQSMKIKTGTCQARVLYLDETNAEQAMLDPETFLQEEGELKASAAGKISLVLKPYAIARVDVV